MWTALFSQLGFDEVSHYSGNGRQQIEKDQRCTTSLRLSSFAENSWKSYPTTPIPRLPTFTGRHTHLEDVATPTKHSNPPHSIESDGKYGNLSMRQKHRKKESVFFYAGDGTAETLAMLAMKD